MAESSVSAVTELWAGFYSWQGHGGFIFCSSMSLWVFTQDVARCVPECETGHLHVLLWLCNVMMNALYNSQSSYIVTHGCVQ